MGFSIDWNERYQNGEHQSIWPWSNLITLLFGYTNIRKRRSSFKILEVGCGAGANIPLFASVESDYSGMDGSEHTIAQLRLKFPNLANQLFVGDFTQSLPSHKKFDLIVDRAAITHNSTADIRATLDHVSAALEPDGIFIGCDWFSTEHQEFSRGAQGEDSFTKTNYSEGPFANLGKVHFSDRKHLEDLFEGFSFLYLSHFVDQKIIPHDGRHAMWQIVAKKK